MAGHKRGPCSPPVSRSTSVSESTDPLDFGSQDVDGNFLSQPTEEPSSQLDESWSSSESSHIITPPDSPPKSVHNAISPVDTKTSLVFDPTPLAISSGRKSSLNEVFDEADHAVSVVASESDTLHPNTNYLDILEELGEPNLVIYATKPGDDIPRLRRAAAELGNHTGILRARQASSTAKETVWLVLGRDADFVQRIVRPPVVMPGTLATDAEMYEGPRLATLSHSLFGGVVGALVFFLLLSSV